MVISGHRLAVGFEQLLIIVGIALVGVGDAGGEKIGDSGGRKSALRRLLFQQVAELEQIGQLAFAERATPDSGGGLRRRRAAR
jgi:hypothetical protein